MFNVNAIVYQASAQIDQYAMTRYVLRAHGCYMHAGKCTRTPLSRAGEVYTVKLYCVCTHLSEWCEINRQRCDKEKRALQTKHGSLLYSC